MIRAQYQVGNRRNSSPTLEVGVFLLEEDKNGVRLEWSRSVFCMYRNVICSCKTKDDNVCMKYRVKREKIGKNDAVTRKSIGKWKK